MYLFIHLPSGPQTNALGSKYYIIPVFLLVMVLPLGLAQSAVPIAIKTRPINGAMIRMATEPFLAPLIVFLNVSASSSSMAND